MYTISGFLQKTFS